ncbi:deleted in malignant brain tumors 1 protein-like isoform X5 [Simochromis diagramma]|uniref:deleted in malignant brain tumors 1 protein-like isoform X5 n=1 Tax=Simochromis diagramma TaxID=43689 RepID=UPI001A7E1D94|nr:deleted in malignant brain tumors 1 protein-like isoform X5 [Simochromis diagramma]
MALQWFVCCFSVMIIFFCKDGHSQRSGETRLSGSGSTRCSGRVEVYHNNSWGTVCDDGWDLNDAQVVCRQLNCGTALGARQSAHFGAGTGQIWLDDVSCSGSESSLIGCQHRGFGTHNCDHRKDAGVICSDVIRLSGSGSTRCSGRVEVYVNNIWGTVCDDGWDLNDAQVVCRQINCERALGALQSAHFGAGTGEIWLDDVTCSGNESSLTECQHSGFGSNRCEHGQDAAVICSGPIRLAGPGSTLCSGRVEVYHNNVWGTVSDYNWDLNDAEVVCRQLNCGSALQAPRSAYFGAGTGQIWLDNVTCSGNESSLTECQHSGFGSNRCEHGQDAAVICSGPIRLAGSGSSRCSGRVEVYHSNRWGTVSDYNWDLNDAEVVCRQLNCGSALQAPRSAHFGAGTGQIWLDDVSCSGNESSLTTCVHNQFGSHNCDHRKDAGVICSDAIRLVGSGSTRCSGRVEIYYNNSWGTVCDDGWDLNDAQVVCRQINCGSALQALQSAHFGAGTGQIWLDDVSCSGSESSLIGCQHSGFGSNRCEHDEDAGVICSGPIRLTGSGSTRCSGRVEVYHNNSWGTVCDDGWDLNDAEVVCRQINCGSALEVPQSAHFGAGTGQIWLDNVTCSGNESSLTECQHSGFGSNRCEHGQDAAVICSGEPIRLVGSGSTRCSGRVEVYHNNSWGTVCDDGWDLNDAEVVCRQLNCGSALEVPQSAHFGAGTGQIWLDNVTCSGNESSLIGCQHRGFGTHNCGHFEDAGVICSDLIRLAGPGSTRCSGRVEIYYNNSWGTVCDDGWDLNDAEVVCRQLNCGTALQAPRSAHFGAGTGQIWLDHVTCSGNESSLTECQHSGFGSNTCEHYEDAAVICSACGRIVKNTGSLPWRVIIDPSGEFWCEGSLITNQWVLTAASCISHDKLSNKVVHLGQHIQSAFSQNVVIRKVEEVICHPEYNSTTYNSDICLLKLSAPVYFTDYIQPICLASKNSTFHSGISSWVTGCGFDYVTLPIVGRNECQCHYKHDKVITENMICAGLRAGSQDSCWWKRGAPIMIKKGSIWVQSGVMTLHDSYGYPMKLEIGTRVSKYQEWIRNTVTGTPPGFVSFTSPATDSDLKFTCSGENLVHFTPFTSLCFLAVLLHAYFGCGI